MQTTSHCSFHFLGFNEDTICVAVARVGSDSQKIYAASLSAMVNADMGEPLHSLIITGKLHPLELDMLATFSDHPEALKSLTQV